MPWDKNKQWAPVAKVERELDEAAEPYFEDELDDDPAAEIRREYLARLADVVSGYPDSKAVERAIADYGFRAAVDALASISAKAKGLAARYSRGGS